MPAARKFHEAALLAMVASGFLALLGSGELDLPTLVLLPLALLIRAAMIAGWIRWSIPSALVTAAAAIYIPFYVADSLWISQDFFRSSIHLICFIAVAKLLTANAPRDFLYLKLIAGMELLAAALLSTELSFFFFLTIFLLSALAAMTSGEVMRSLERSRSFAPVRPRLLRTRLAMMSSGLFFAVMAVAVGLFFVLPRTAGAMFLRFGTNRGPLPMSSEVLLGDLGRLQQDTAAVMHVQSYDGRSLDGLRWRGAALSQFDGKRWYNKPAREEELPVKLGQLLLSPAGERSGLSMGYYVELEDLAPDTLFFAGIPESINIQSPRLFRSPSGSIRAPRRGLLRYGVYSNLTMQDPTPLTEEQRREFLSLPPLDPRIANLAREWSKQSQSPAQIARAFEQRFHRDFRYSLDALDAPVADPLAHFLFERRAGHCEYFASGMAVMLRSVGIPARVATGFLGGVFNSISGWQLLRAADAHSWVEAWIPGRGWTTFDPTPSDPTAVQPSAVFLRAQLLMDAAEQFWRDWVVTYDVDHQRALVSRMQDARRTWHWAVAWPAMLRFAPSVWVSLAVAAAVMFLVIRFGPALLGMWKNRRRLAHARRGARQGRVQATDATLLYERMLRVLEARGWRREPSSTPSEFARTLPPSELALLVEDLTRAYNQVRFGAHADAAPRMAQLLQRIEGSVE
jgi:transglutaminase-like putative cysteine protease